MVGSSSFWEFLCISAVAYLLGLPTMEQNKNNYI